MKKHSFLLLASLIGGLAVGNGVKISSVDEFIQFKDNVNSGTTYYGTTVLLDSDLDLSGKDFEPIGTANQFNGVFDGQGNVISNLAMDYSSSQYAGLFGYSYGLTIRNVILDSSCSITSSYSGSSYAFVGGIIGDIYASTVPCTIENSVNMASVIFTGNTNSELYLGGIVGYLSSSSRYDSIVKNCANYGDVTYSGKSYISYIGGVAGYSEGYSSNKVYVYNSLNYGAITYSGTTTREMYLGGISGFTRYTNIENCVSAAGEIESTGTAATSYIGSIVGYIIPDVSINYCYITSELSGYSKCGTGTLSESNVLSYNSATFELGEAVTVGEYTGTSLIDALNAAAADTRTNYSHWLLNKNSKAVTFTINNDRAAPISMSYQIILTPSLAGEGIICFDGWYEDSALTTPLTSHEVTSDTALYGKWGVNTNSYTITFDARREGVTVEPITAQFGSVVTLPSDSIRENCSVMFWENKYGDNVGLSLITPAHNITLYAAVWKCTHLKTPEDLIDFSKVVNSGADTFKGTTVFLDSDLDFTGKTFEPIGSSASKCFRGVFNGQGHVISNLAMNSSSNYVGLFGVSQEFTIRNVILDSSCSITSFYGSSDPYVGGIIGRCFAYNGLCNIDNNVNMGSVSFTGNTNGYSLYLGGIAGYLISYYSYDSTVKNCANYGDITHSGMSYNSAIGGIVGYSKGYSSYYKVYIYNSLNYGTITHDGTTSNILRLGGIIGYSAYTDAENCVSAGKISTPTTAIENLIGSILGEIYSDVSVDYCYITSELSSYNKYGTGTPSSESNVTSYNSTAFELSEAATVGEYTGASLISALNAYADTIATYSHWLLNKNKKTVTFTINGRAASISMSYQIILMPSLASEGSMVFDGWYEDSTSVTPLASYEVTSDTALYSLYGVILTVTFDKNGGESVSFTSKKVALNDVYGELPETTKTGYSAGWFTAQTGGEQVESGSIVTTDSNHTLYAQWTINQYTITFDFNNGTVSDTVLDFDSLIEYPEDMTRVGFTFGGWDSKPERMPAENITVKAQWNINQYTITFDFSNGTVSSVVLDFDSLIEYPENMTRVGFTFGGWDSKPERMPAENITVKAQWDITNPVKYVEVMFSKEGMTEEEARKVVEELVPEGTKFSVTIAESDSEGTKVVVKFNNAEAAKKFVETVSASSEAEKSGIKAVEFSSDDKSFATSLGLSVLASFLAYLLSF